jgi:flavin-dependent dehydrogenase
MRQLLPDHTEVLIAGAGPAGSALAFHLACRGVAVTVVDRALFPRDKPCSEYMSPETVRLLDRIGVVAALEAEGAPLRGTSVIGARGAMLSGEFARLRAPPWRSTGLSVARRVLDHQLMLAARQAGARVAEGIAVTGVLEEQGGVVGLTVSSEGTGPREIRARLTVGADGLRSVVARRSARHLRGVPARMGFVAHVGDVPGLHERAEMHVGREGYVGLNPIGRGLTNVALVMPTRRASAAAGDATRFFFDELERYPGVRGRVSAGRLVREVLVTGPFAVRSRPVVRDGALLVGDAADFFDPFTGEGIYRALRGAEIAAEVVAPLLAEPGPITARDLTPYVSARRQAFLGTWGVERLIGFAMLWPGLFDHAVARLGRRSGMADTLIGVTGDCIPAGAVLNPLFLARMLI